MRPNAIIQRDMADAVKGCRRALSRRAVFEAGIGGLCWVAVSSVKVLGQDDPASMPPQEGDVLVKAGDATLKPLTVGDMQREAKHVAAWSMAPATKLVRSANRLHELLLVRVDPTVLVGEALANAAEGVLAYSALCTHTGCDVSTWVPDEGILSCDCHGSEFNAREAGKVLVGPAIRALPPLPLKLDGDVLVVAKPFASAIRFDEG